MFTKINDSLYDNLIIQYENSVSVTVYKRSVHWVKTHLQRLCSEFSWLQIGGLVKHNIGGTIRVSKVLKFYVNEHSVLVDVGFGNVWYYECIEPSKNEIENFDGHCLVIEN